MFQEKDSFIMDINLSIYLKSLSILLSMYLYMYHLGIYLFVLRKDSFVLDINQ
jgi:hypothetical protein